MLCDIIYNSGKFPGASGDNTCELLRTIVKPFSDQIGADPSQNQSQPAPAEARRLDPDHHARGPARLA